jgi:ATP-dependent DNA ligase
MLVLDGEVAVYHQQLRSRFDWLREPDTNVATPPVFMVFDILHRVVTCSRGHYRIAAPSWKTSSRAAS